MLDIHEEIDYIVNVIKSRPCYGKLKKQEEIMEQNEEVIHLASIFSKAQMDYSDGMKHYEEGSKELDALYKNLVMAKYNLDSHPIVMEYYDLFSEVNDPLNYIQFKLLSLFKNHNGKCE